MIIELYELAMLSKTLAVNMVLSKVTIAKWIKQISPISSIDDNEIALEEIKRTKQEMLHLQEKNKIFKKAMTIPSSS